MPLIAASEVAGLRIGGVAGQLQASDYRRPPRKDRHSVPALLATPHCMIACLADRFRRKLGVRGLQLLKADDVRVRFA